MDLLLSPIYGPELKSGLTEDDRDLAKVKELPVATDGSPALFVNIENAKNDKSGVNKKELEVVLDFIQVLKVRQPFILEFIHFLEERRDWNGRSRRL